MLFSRSGKQGELVKPGKSDCPHPSSEQPKSFAAPTGQFSRSIRTNKPQPRPKQQKPEAPTKSAGSNVRLTEPLRPSAPKNFCTQKEAAPKRVCRIPSQLLPTTKRPFTKTVVKNVEIIPEGYANKLCDIDSAAPGTQSTVEPTHSPSSSSNEQPGSLIGIPDSNASYKSFSSENQLLLKNLGPSERTARACEILQSSKENSVLDTSPDTVSQASSPVVMSPQTDHLLMICHRSESHASPFLQPLRAERSILPCTPCPIGLLDSQFNGPPRWAARTSLNAGHAQLMAQVRTAFGEVSNLETPPIGNNKLTVNATPQDLIRWSIHTPPVQSQITNTATFRPNAPRRKSPSSKRALISGIMRSSPGLVELAIKELGADPNRPLTVPRMLKSRFRSTYEGNSSEPIAVSPLLLATKVSGPCVAEKLLDFGSSVNQTDSNQRTALHWMFLPSFSQCKHDLETLRRQYEQSNAKASNGGNIVPAKPQDSFSQDSRLNPGERPSLSVTPTPRVVTPHILTKDPSNALLEISDVYFPWESGSDRAKIVEILCLRGAAIELKDSEGKTAAMYAREWLEAVVIMPNQRAGIMAGAFRLLAFEDTLKLKLMLPIISNYNLRSRSKRSGLQGWSKRSGLQGWSKRSGLQGWRDSKSLRNDLTPSLKGCHSALGRSGRQRMCKIKRTPTSELMYLTKKYSCNDGLVGIWQFLGAEFS